MNASERKDEIKTAPTLTKDEQKSSNLEKLIDKIYGMGLEIQPKDYEEIAVDLMSIFWRPDIRKLFKKLPYEYNRLKKGLKMSELYEEYNKIPDQIQTTIRSCYEEETPSKEYLLHILERVLLQEGTPPDRMVLYAAQQAKKDLLEQKIKLESSISDEDFINLLSTPSLKIIGKTPEGFILEAENKDQLQNAYESIKTLLTNPNEQSVQINRDKNNLLIRHDFLKILKDKAQQNIITVKFFLDHLVEQFPAGLFQYALVPMSSLPDGDEEKAESNKIYLSNDGKFLVRNPYDIVRKGEFDTNHLKGNLADHFNDDQFIKYILELISFGWYTIGKCFGNATATGIYFTLPVNVHGNTDDYKKFWALCKNQGDQGIRGLRRDNTLEVTKDDSNWMDRHFKIDDIVNLQNVVNKINNTIPIDQMLLERALKWLSEYKKDFSKPNKLIYCYHLLGKINFKNLNSSDKGKVGDLLLDLVHNANPGDAYNQHYALALACNTSYNRALLVAHSLIRESEPVPQDLPANNLLRVHLLQDSYSSSRSDYLNQQSAMPDLDKLTNENLHSINKNIKQHNDRDAFLSKFPEWENLGREIGRKYINLDSSKLNNIINLKLACEAGQESQRIGHLKELDQALKDARIDISLTRVIEALSLGKGVASQQGFFAISAHEGRSVQGINSPAALVNTEPQDIKQDIDPSTQPKPRS